MTKQCVICDSKTEVAFTAKVLNKYPVSYYRCGQCGFIQTEQPHWLEEAYQSPITFLDIGLLSRNVSLSTILAPIIDGSFDHKGKFLDYAGGYGILTRLMRDNGYDFYHTDPYCKNIFARNFELKDSNTSSFELITAFEFFEHIYDPINELSVLLDLADNIIFSTELVPARNTALSPKNWDYIAPETGQHISFYTSKALKKIAKKLDLQYHNNGSLHLFTKTAFSTNPLESTGKIKSKSSLTPKDHRYLQDNSSILSPKPEIAFEKNDLPDFDKHKLSVLRNQNVRLKKSLKSKIQVIKNLTVDLSNSKVREIELENALLRVRETKLWRSAEYLRSIKNKSLEIKITLEDFISQRLSLKAPSTHERKRIILVDHAYHKKTKSFEFLASYLREHFIVNHLFVNDSDYDNEIETIISKHDFDIIWFLQILPNHNVSKMLEGNAILSIMYDGHGHQHETFWHKYRDFKFVNFSRELHLKHRLSGCKSIYLQYFPKPQGVVNQNNKRAFFWQRVDSISIKTVLGLIPNNIKLNVHWAPDPKQSVPASDLQLHQKRIKHTTRWEESGKSYKSSLKDCGIYIAPRPFEGIGHSFLEALSMGKAIIAVDNPTMNEYLKHNETGYLYNLNDIKEINLSNIDFIQKNALKLAKKGHIKWINDRKRLAQYIST